MLRGGREQGSWKLLVIGSRLLPGPRSFKGYPVLGLQYYILAR